MHWLGGGVLVGNRLLSVLLGDVILLDGGGGLLLLVGLLFILLRLLVELLRSEVSYNQWTNNNYIYENTVQCSSGSNAVIHAVNTSNMKLVRIAQPWLTNKVIAASNLEPIKQPSGPINGRLHSLSQVHKLLAVTGLLLFANLACSIRLPTFQLYHESTSDQTPFPHKSQASKIRTQFPINYVVVKKDEHSHAIATVPVVS